MSTRSIFRDVNKPSNLCEDINNKIKIFYDNRVVRDWGGRHILRGMTPRSDDVVLSSNDYLSISGTKEIVDRQIKALRDNGKEVFMSAIFLHGDTPQDRFERAMAEYMQSERTILTQSGWDANVGLIQTLADENTKVYVDFLAHMSLWEGIECAKATALPFRHNDMSSLENKIKKHGKGLILVDSVYSTNGDICPLVELVDIGEKYGCTIIVDESHSLGTHGPNGAGLVVDLNLQDRVHFRTASLAKTFASRGGIISCNDSFYDYFAFTSRPAIFSSSVLPHEIEGMLASLEVIKASDDRRKRLFRIANYIRSGIDSIGYNVDASKSQIISLESGTESQTITARDALEKHGVFGAIFCDPATPKNRALVRFSIHSEITDSEANKIISACAAIRNEVGMSGWASTRRKVRSGYQATA